MGKNEKTVKQVNLTTGAKWQTSHLKKFRKDFITALLNSLLILLTLKTKILKRNKNIFIFSFISRGYAVREKSPVDCSRFESDRSGLRKWIPTRCANVPMPIGVRGTTPTLAFCPGNRTSKKPSEPTADTACLILRSLVPKTTWNLAGSRAPSLKVTGKDVSLFCLLPAKFFALKPFLAYASMVLCNFHYITYFIKSICAM